MIPVPPELSNTTKDVLFLMSQNLPLNIIETVATAAAVAAAAVATAIAATAATILMSLFKIIVTTTTAVEVPIRTRT